MTLAGVGARACFCCRCAPIFRRAGGGGGKPPGCNSVRTVWPKTSNPISGGNGAWRRRSPARATGAACSTAARTADRDWRRSTRRRCGPENDCAACGFDLASAKAPRLGAGARRAAANLGGPRPTRDGRGLRPCRRDPRPAGEARSAASGGVDGAPYAYRARAHPALARGIDRLSAAATDGDAQPKAACRKHAGLIIFFFFLKKKKKKKKKKKAPRPHFS